MNFKKYIYCAFLLIAIGAGTAFAQNKTTTLDELISSLEKKHNIAFSFDRNLLKDVPVSIDTTLSLHHLLETLDAQTAFTFDKLDKKNILIKPKAVGYNFVLQGVVSDTKTHEPLYTTILYSKKSNFNTSCKEDGSFYKIIHYMPGDTIQVIMAGYEPLSLPIRNFENSLPVAIHLKSKLIEMNEVSVTAYLTSGIEYDQLDNSIIIRPKNRSILPGQTNGDILLSLDALPGISSTDSKAGNLNIRGSTPDQTLITFDNIPLYQKGHIFGTISPFNANVVDNIKVQRGSMSANRGGRVGGIIEINTPTRVANKPNVTIASSMMDASAYAHVPVIKNKLSVFVSGRYSYPYSWNSPSMAAISKYIFQMTEINGAQKNHPGSLKKLDVNYGDYNAKIIANINEKHKLTLSGLYNTDLLSAIIDDVNRHSKSNYTINTLNSGINGMLSSDWSVKFSTRLSLTNSIYQQKNETRIDDSNKTISKANYENTVKDLRIFLESEFRVNSKHMIRAGYDMNNYQTLYIKRNDDTSNVSFKQDYIKNGTVNTVFVNWLATPFKKFLLDLGLRMNYYTISKKVTPEPRLMLGYKMTDAFRLKASAGYQKQFISQVSGISVQSVAGLQSLLWILADDEQIPEVNSYQVTGGFIFEKNSWLIDAEAYYKQIENVSNISITQPLSKTPFIHGTINVTGVDVLIRKQWKSIDAWISYTNSRSMMQFDSVQPSAFYSLYDQTHVLDIAGSYSIKQWKFSLAWKYRSGLAVLKGIRTKMMAGPDSSPKSNSQPPSGPPAGSMAAGGEKRYDNRFPAYHMLDASVQYSFPKTPKKWNGFIGVSVLNCYDQKNIMDQSMITDNGQRKLTNRYMMGIMPNAVVSISF